MTVRTTIWLSSLVAVFLWTGCATEKVDWKTRIGNYTYDQAVKEYGPPDHREKLTDGTVVADWEVRESHTVVMPHPNLTPPDGLGPAMPGYSSTYVPSYYMRLTFGPDDHLQSYKDFTK